MRAVAPQTRRADSWTTRKHFTFLIDRCRQIPRNRVFRILGLALNAKNIRSEERAAISFRLAIEKTRKGAIAKKRRTTNVTPALDRRLNNRISACHPHCRGWQSTDAVRLHSIEGDIHSNVFLTVKADVTTSL
jgi:hypothetical protein